MGNIFQQLRVLAGGIPIPLKNMSLVSWDDDIPNIWKVIKVMFQTTNQVRLSDCVYCSKSSHTHTRQNWIF